MKTIPLTQGYFTKVDDDDYEKFAIYRWYADTSRSSEIRAVRSVYITKGKVRRITLSRVIMNVSNEFKVDHINGNTLDNRKCNLRICTQAQNTRNRIKPKVNTSGYKGVSKQTKGKKWIARVANIYLGLFDNPEDAAIAYDKKAKELFGEFAHLNYEPKSN